MYILETQNYQDGNRKIQKDEGEGGGEEAKHNIGNISVSVNYIYEGTL